MKAKNKLVNFLAHISAFKSDKNYLTVHFHTDPDPCQYRQAVLSSCGHTLWRQLHSLFVNPFAVKPYTGEV